MEQPIMRALIQKGLPLTVHRKLAEVVGLGSMTKSVYTELFHKKEQDQNDQDQETLQKLNQLQLMDNKKKEKKQALVIQAWPDPPPLMQMGQAESQQPPFVKVFRRKRCQRPGEVVGCTGTAAQVKGSPTWYHLSHYAKARDGEAPRVQCWDVELSTEPSEGAGDQEDLYRPAQLENITEDFVCPASARDNTAKQKERRFDMVDSENLPGSAGSGPECYEEWSHSGYWEGS